MWAVQWLLKERPATCHLRKAHQRIIQLYSSTLHIRTKLIRPLLKETTYKTPLWQKACRLGNFKNTRHANDPPFPFPPSNKTEARSQGGRSLCRHPSHRQTGFFLVSDFAHTQILPDSARQSRDCYTWEICSAATNSFGFICVANANILEHLCYKLALKHLHYKLLLKSGCLVLVIISIIHILKRLKIHKLELLTFPALGTWLLPAASSSNTELSWLSMKTQARTHIIFLI